MEKRSVTLHNQQADITIPDAVLKLLTTAFGAPVEAIAPTVGGFSNLTFFATLGGMHSVVKAATLPVKRQDVRREATMLAALAETAIPAPVLLQIVEDEHWTVAVTRTHAGRNGLQVLAHVPDQLESLFGALGAALGRVHAATPQVRADFALAERLSESRAFVLDSSIDAALRDQLVTSLSHPIWQTEAPRLVHGDVGLHNTLWDGASLLLLDWEWASIGQPLLDLAWLRWTMRWRALDESLWQAALAAYQQVNRPLPRVSESSVRALMLGQIAMILTRVRDQRAATAEWQRRAGWTLALPDTAIWFV